MSGPQLEPEDLSSGEPEQALGPVATGVLGTYFIVVAILLGYTLYTLWRVGPLDPETQKVDEVKLILIVMIAGALGSYVHAATSFADFVGGASPAQQFVVEPGA